MGISTFAVGGDIGYGNLKLAVRAIDGESASEIVLPVGAAPVELAPKLVNGEVDLRGGAVVRLDNEDWIAGVDPSALQGFARQTHEGYPTTKEYLALLYAALVKLDVRHIDVLVTGLPCQQYFPVAATKPFQKNLIHRLQGTHRPTPAFTCTIDRVFLTAQPAGTFTAVEAENPDLTNATGQPVLVVDVGYYSVDWVLMKDRSIHDLSSGSSQNATSTILEEAAHDIGIDHHVHLSPDRLEAVYRNNEPSLPIGSANVDYHEYLNRAASRVPRRAIASIASSLRHETDTVSRVILTGGGAALFRPGIQAAFGRSNNKTVIVADRPVLANARGFLELALRASDNLKRAVA